MVVKQLDAEITEFAEMLYALRGAMGIKKIKNNILSFLLANHLIRAHQIKTDGLWCPRCGDMFHDRDILRNPRDYYECPKCYAVQHTRCRGNL